MSWQLITPGTESAIALIASGAIAYYLLRLTRRIERLGYQASLEPVTANSSPV